MQIIILQIGRPRRFYNLKLIFFQDEFVEKSKTENKCLQDAKLKLSEERKSAQSIIKTLKEDKNLLSEKIDELKKKLQTALDEYHSHKASSEEYKKVLEEKIKLINDQHADLLSRANLKFKDLEKEKNVKENEVEDLKAYVSELQIKHKKDIKNLEEKLSKSAEKSKKYIKEIEEQLLTANKEVEKANDIIGKLHRELRVCKSKLAISLTENENLNNVLQKRTKLLAEKEEECKVVQSQKDIINSLDAAIAQKNNDLQALQKLVANLKGLKETKNLKLLREEYYDVACANQVNQISAAMQTFASLEDVTDSEKSLQMPSYLNSVLKKKSRDPQSTCLMGGVVAQDSEVIRQ
ncbi:coiled-coil domain-containing protein 39-like [Zophobas morio]|uniref:coiled-coil domain-containing protein 39-like n=1 Tax=Zophobas morio TaxID=2755281 RepID=UPI0030835F5A